MTSLKLFWVKKLEKLSFVSRFDYFKHISFVNVLLFKKPTYIQPNKPLFKIS